MHTAAAIVLVGSMAAAAAQQPAFEVASVKPNMSGDPGQSGERGKGAFRATNMRLRALIVTAYDIRPERIVGLPSWTDEERFDVNARAPAGTPDSQLPLMLRTLLAERFHLVARSETREQPVYALVMARANGPLGASLTPSTECDSRGMASIAAAPTALRPCGVLTRSDARVASITGGARSMDVLVRSLQGLADRPVINRTGLIGTYDFELRFAAAALGAEAGAVPDAPSIYVAVQEQLGLKLDPQRGPVEFLVVERIERPAPD